MIALDHALGRRGSPVLRAAALAWLLLVAGPVLSATAEAPLRVAVVSDLNGSYGSTDYESTVARAVARILALRPDLVISTGDMVAGQRRPHLSRAEIEQMWAAFHTAVSDPLAAAGIPLVVVPGNHDASAYAGFEAERAIFAAQWTPRAPPLRFVDNDAFPFQYAFAAGNTLFVALDVTTLGHLPAESMTWLRKVLTESGADFQYRVVFSHLPLWPLAHGREREVIGDPRLQSLLEEAHVDLYLSGHHHAFYPGSKGSVAFVAQACLGAGARRLLGSAKRSPKGFTLLELGEGPARVTAFSGPELATPLDWGTLPRAIRSPLAELQRADLAGTALPGAGRPNDATAAPVGAAP